MEFHPKVQLRASPRTPDRGRKLGQLSDFGVRPVDSLLQDHRGGVRLELDTIKRIRGWLAPYGRWVGLASFLTALAVAVNMQSPLIVQGLVDDVVAPRAWNRLPWYGAALMGVFTAQAVIGFANTMVVGHVGQRLVRDMRHQLYERLQQLSLGYYDRTPTGSVISRMMDDVGAVQTFVTGQTFTILTDMGTTFAISGLLFWRNWRLALVVVLFAPLYGLNFRFFMKKIRATNKIIREKMDVLFGHLKEKLDGVVVIKSHARETAEVAGFVAELEDVHDPRVAEVRLRNAFGNISAAISGLGTAAVFGAGSLEVLHGRMTPGEVISTAALAGMLFGPIARLADLAYVFEQAGASVDRVGEILDLKPEVVEPENPVQLDYLRGEVRYDSVSFAYGDGPQVLNDIDLEIRPGQKVAFVGHTGCGKTTMVSLLLRFYDVKSGAIRLDGIDIRRLNSRELRRRIGIVPQEPIVFRGTIADNIRYGNPEATEAQVEAASKAALVHDFTMELPEGYSTLVGEGGHKLSQGQRQRLSIARALCMDPALVILDEATSSLDTLSESLIQKALKNLLSGRTAIIIAHRLSTIVDSDMIVVMERGRILQKGPHSELITDTAGIYRQLCVSQFGDAALSTFVRKPESDSKEPLTVLDFGISRSQPVSSEDRRHA
jgi:ABC-type multidrug transport system fused ATPase/permease subunit